MPLAPGARLGPYEIVAPAGAGGMGEVYQARDTRLDRVVAVKVLPSHLAADPALRERFDREARAISQLNHPHICVLHDVGRHEGIEFLVMEFLHGETLGETLARGALPLPQALSIAIQIADALDRAHRAGIVHRDLKPSNVFLVREGSSSAPPLVKLLDFGLAKSGSPIASDATASPTLAQALTGRGTILGTLHYMAPEQLEGRDADARADVFAFGALLYEMLTGKRAFDGKSEASVIAAILSVDPPALSALQPVTPPALDHLVTRALAKDPLDRWSSIHDVLLQLQWIAANPSADAAPAVTGWSRERRRWIAACAALVTLALVGVAWSVMRAPREAPTALIQFEIDPPRDATFSSAGLNASYMTPVISHDGSRIVLPAFGLDGLRRLWLRSLATPDLQPVAGTEGVMFPFWSPDDRAIAFFADGRLMRLDLDGGSPRVLCDAPAGSGGTWNRDGIIVFAPTAEGPLHRVSASGGASTPVTELAAGYASHRFPDFLPDGRHFVFLARGNDRADILAGSIDSTDVQRLLALDRRAMFVAPHWLTFVRGGTLFAQQFNPDRLELKGEPLAIRQGVAADAVSGTPSFWFSQRGSFVYRGVDTARRDMLTWYTRSGAILSTVGDPSDYTVPQLSPDGRRLAVATGTGGARGAIWVRDLIRGTFSRLTNGPNDCCPAWSPDAAQIVFRKGPRDLALKASNGTGSDTVILANGASNTPTQWSPDGKAILYQTGGNVLLVPVSEPRTPKAILSGPSNEEQARLSPDGRWLAYTSDESGRPEVYVQDFPALSQKWPISTNGGADPQWRRDGLELFFIGADQKMMAVPIRRGAAFDPGIPVALFQTRVTGLTDVRTHYQVSADGQRFLVNTMGETERGAPVQVVVNWESAIAK